MNRGNLLLATLALLSMLAGVSLYHWTWDSEVSRAGDAVQAQKITLDSIPLTDINGVETTLSDWRGDRLIVNFWAPWCIPCRREIPLLIEIQQEYADQGVKVLGIALDEKKSVVEFAREYAINYPLFLAGNRISMYNAAFSNRSSAIPFTLLLDRNLNIVFSHYGEVSRELLEQQLNPL